MFKNVGWRPYVCSIRTKLRATLTSSLNWFLLFIITYFWVSNLKYFSIGVKCFIWFFYFYKMKGKLNNNKTFNFIVRQNIIIIILKIRIIYTL